MQDTTWELSAQTNLPDVLMLYIQSEANIAAGDLANCTTNIYARYLDNENGHAGQGVQHARAEAATAFPTCASSMFSGS